MRMSCILPKQNDFDFILKCGFDLCGFFRVAKEEEHNKMTPSSLAIVFAPCILRSPDMDDPFLGMKDVAKTTT